MDLTIPDPTPLAVGGLLVLAANAVRRLVRRLVKRIDFTMEIRISYGGSGALGGRVARPGAPSLLPSSLK